MSVLADWEITKHCYEKGDQAMIQPFIAKSVKVNEAGARIVSFGLSSFGYDARLADEIKVFTDLSCSQVDPKKFDERSVVTVTPTTDEETGVRSFLIPPHSFALARTVEKFNIPRDVVAICLGKSTYARCGVIVNVTPLEPEWIGYVTLELSNTAPVPVRVYVDEGVCQFLFIRGEEPRVSYADRGGKYQNQVGITSPKV